MPHKTYFTSESVTEGHPDKICDQISDAVLDDLLRQDPDSRVAVECLTTVGMVMVAGEVTTRGWTDVQRVAREVIKEIGYHDGKSGLDWETCAIIESIHEQSPDISQGVSVSERHEQGAGDQGMMFGYACRETEELMPLPITCAHKLTQRLSFVRKQGILPYLGPDGKSQVTIEYSADNKPKRVAAIVIAAQHTENVSRDQLVSDIKSQVIEPVLMGIRGKSLLSEARLEDIKIHINETGRFVIGGPQADSGLTGRKIIVDTYGGMGRHGGGAFCIEGSSYVNTEKGLQQIRDMKQDVEKGLIAKTDIHPHKIGDWYDNGLSSTIEVATNGGYTLRGTPNHRIRVMDNEGNYIWRRLDCIKGSDYVAIHKKDRLFGSGPQLDQFSYTYKEGTAEGRKNKFTFPKVLTEDYSYLLGLLVGDGNCMREGAIAICVCETEQVKNVQRLYKRLFGRTGKIFGHWAFIGGVELRAYLQHLGLERKRSWEKKVPWSIFQATKDCMAAFLRGLFDTDGGIRIHGRNKNFPDIQLTSTSVALIKEVQQLLLNFGIITGVQCVDRTGVSFVIGEEQRKATSRRPLYHVRIKDIEGVKRFKEYIGFGLERKQKILDNIQFGNKRTHFILPHQRERIQRLWSKLSSREHQKDICNIGRFTRSLVGKATKNLTYEKLKEFLRIYKERLGYDKDFQYIEFLYNLGHFYDRVKQKKLYASVPTYDLYVPESHTFIANGFVCHNSGKDPSKVDRSGAYMARYIAKNIVASGMSERAEVQISYAIGVARPVSVRVETDNTALVSEDKIAQAVENIFDMRPAAIIDHLRLKRPIYKPIAAYGHFGRNDLDLTWEMTDKTEELKRLVG